MDVYSKTEGILLYRVKRAIERAVFAFCSDLDEDTKKLLDTLVQEGFVVRIGDVYICRTGVGILLQKLNEIIGHAFEIRVSDVVKITGLPESVIRWLITDRYYVFADHIYPPKLKDKAIQRAEETFSRFIVIGRDQISDLLLGELERLGIVIRVGDIVIGTQYMQQLKDALDTVGSDRNLKELAALIGVDPELIRVVSGKLGYIVVDDTLYPIQKYLISLLSEKAKFRTRWGTTISLGLIYHKTGNSDIFRILQYLLSSKDRRTRISAIIAMGLLFRSTNNSRPKRLIEQIIRKNDPVETRAALMAWGLITYGRYNAYRDPQFIAKFLCHENRKIKGGSAIALGLMLQGSGNRSWLNTMRAMLFNSDDDVAIDALIGISLMFRGVGGLGGLFNPASKVLKILTPLLESENYMIRWHAALAIGHIYRGSANRKVAELVSPLLDDTEYRIRWGAISLGLIYEGTANREVFEKLKSLRGYLDSRVQSGLALAVGLLFVGRRDPYATDLILSLLRSPEADVKEYAAISLGMLYHRSEDPDIANILRNLLDHSNPVVRWGAIIGLSLIYHATGSWNAFSVIRKLFEDPDKEVRWASTLALGIIYKNKPTDIPLYILGIRSRYNSIDWLTILI